MKTIKEQSAIDCLLETSITDQELLAGYEKKISSHNYAYIFRFERYDMIYFVYAMPMPDGQYVWTPIYIGLFDKSEKLPHGYIKIKIKIK